MFSVRLVTADHYLTAPIKDLDVCYSDFRGSQVTKVPVIRIFGSTPMGQKTCLHVHGVFPYILVPYDGQEDETEKFTRMLAVSIDKAINIALGSSNSTTQHVFKITVVSGMPFYGYHETEKQFLRIYLYNPGLIKKMIELLQNGAVMNQVFQPHEAHAPFLLQMFIDYNLFGMSLVNLKSVKFRVHKDQSASSSSYHDEVPELSCKSLSNASSLGSEPSQKYWNQKHIPKNLILGEAVERQSTCELEVDAFAYDIMNRVEVDAVIKDYTNPGIKTIWEDERQRKRLNMESSQITPPPSQDRNAVPVTVIEKCYLEKFRSLSKDIFAEMSQENLNASLNASPACQLERHHSFRLGSQSPRRVDEEALVDEDIIQQTMHPALNESFSENIGSEELAEMMAGMITDSIPKEQEKGDGDSSETELEHESLEMSQIIWFSDEPPSQPGEENWNRKLSQESAYPTGNYRLAQLDGANDEKFSHDQQNQNFRSQHEYSNHQYNNYSYVQHANNFSGYSQDYNYCNYQNSWWPLSQPYNPQSSFGGNLSPDYNNCNNEQMKAKSWPRSNHEYSNNAGAVESNSIGHSEPFDNFNSVSFADQNALSQTYSPYVNSISTLIGYNGFSGPTNTSYVHEHQSNNVALQNVPTSTSASFSNKNHPTPANSFNRYHQTPNSSSSYVNSSKPDLNTTSYKASNISQSGAYTPLTTVQKVAMREPLQLKHVISKLHENSRKYAQDFETSHQSHPNSSKSHPNGPNSVAVNRNNCVGFFSHSNKATTEIHKMASTGIVKSIQTAARSNETAESFFQMEKLKGVQKDKEFETISTDSIKEILSTAAKKSTFHVQTASLIKKTATPVKPTKEAKPKSVSQKRKTKIRRKNIMLDSSDDEYLPSLSDIMETGNCTPRKLRSKNFGSENVSQDSTSCEKEVLPQPARLNDDKNVEISNNESQATSAACDDNLFSRLFPCVGQDDAASKHQFKIIKISGIKIKVSKFIKRNHLLKIGTEKVVLKRIAESRIPKTSCDKLRKDKKIPDKLPTDEISFSESVRRCEFINSLKEKNDSVRQGIRTKNDKNVANFSNNSNELSNGAIADDFADKSPTRGVKIGGRNLRRCIPLSTKALESFQHDFIEDSDFENDYDLKDAKLPDVIKPTSPLKKYWKVTPSKKGSLSLKVTQCLSKQTPNRSKSKNLGALIARKVPLKSHKNEKKRKSVKQQILDLCDDAAELSLEANSKVETQNLAKSKQKSKKQSHFFGHQFSCQDEVEKGSVVNADIGNGRLDVNLNGSRGPKCNDMSTAVNNVPVKEPTIADVNKLKKNVIVLVEKLDLSQLRMPKAVENPFLRPEDEISNCDKQQIQGGEDAEFHSEESLDCLSPAVDSPPLEQYKRSPLLQSTDSALNHENSLSDAEFVDDSLESKKWLSISGNSSETDYDECEDGNLTKTSNKCEESSTTGCKTNNLIPKSPSESRILTEEDFEKLRKSISNTQEGDGNVSDSASNHVRVVVDDLLQAVQAQLVSIAKVNISQSSELKELQESGEVMTQRNEDSCPSSPEIFRSGEFDSSDEEVNLYHNVDLDIAGDTVHRAAEESQMGKDSAGFKSPEDGPEIFISSPNNSNIYEEVISSFNSSQMEVADDNDETFISSGVSMVSGQSDVVVDSLINDEPTCDAIMCSDESVVLLDVTAGESSEVAIVVGPVDDAETGASDLTSLSEEPAKDTIESSKDSMLGGDLVLPIPHSGHQKTDSDRDDALDHQNESVVLLDVTVGESSEDAVVVRPDDGTETGASDLTSLSEEPAKDTIESLKDSMSGGNLVSPTPHSEHQKMDSERDDTPDHQNESIVLLDVTAVESSEVAIVVGPVDYAETGASDLTSLSDEPAKDTIESSKDSMLGEDLVSPIPHSGHQKTDPERDYTPDHQNESIILLDVTAGKSSEDAIVVRPDDGAETGACDLTSLSEESAKDTIESSKDSISGGDLVLPNPHLGHQKTDSERGDTPDHQNDDQSHFLEEYFAQSNPHPDEQRNTPGESGSSQQSVDSNDTYPKTPSSLDISRIQSFYGDKSIFVEDEQSTLAEEILPGDENANSNPTPEICRLDLGTLQEHVNDNGKQSTLVEELLTSNENRNSNPTPSDGSQELETLQDRPSTDEEISTSGQKTNPILDDFVSDKCCEDLENPQKTVIIHDKQSTEEIPANDKNKNAHPVLEDFIPDSCGKDLEGLQENVNDNNEQSTLDEEIPISDVNTHSNPVLDSFVPNDSSKDLEILQEHVSAPIADKENGKIIIVPCKRPPSQQTVADWANSRKDRLASEKEASQGSAASTQSPSPKSHLKSVTFIYSEGKAKKNVAQHKKIKICTPKASQTSKWDRSPDYDDIRIKPERLSERGDGTQRPIKRPLHGESDGRKDVKRKRNSSSDETAENEKKERARRRLLNESMLEGPSFDNTYNFDFSLDVGFHKSIHQTQHLSTLSMEIHVKSRGDLKPDPKLDPVIAIFYYLHQDDSKENSNQCGVLIQSQVLPTSDVTTAEDNSITKVDKRLINEVHELKQIISSHCTTRSTDVIVVTNEEELLQEFILLVRRFDPDILVGYEVQMLSWGYLIDRASHFNIDLCPQLSRVPTSKSVIPSGETFDWYGADHMTEIHIVGRVVLNGWRIFRSHVTLNIYSFENVYYHVMHERIPAFSAKSLSYWFNKSTPYYRWKTVEYYVVRVQGLIRMLNQIDCIGQTSELARVFGIQLYDVLTRGSQLRVESMMLRSLRMRNFIAASPSVHQRAQSLAPEYIPLVMEPKSAFYTDPVLVLDFQSLYPSICIAYNYCYSTCLGRAEALGKADSIKFGCLSLNSPLSLLHKLKDDVTISPAGHVFVTKNIRHGILPQMLSELLNTRIMVKKCMKDYKDDKALYKLLDARQLGLKLISNFTYGYTSANFSGRMPCVEVADSIVSKARQTLEQAIQLVHNTKKWKAEVVYGDTDSLFVHLPGRTKSEAFEIGKEIVDAVTAVNPKPVKLKFEKVYLPCILETKKRYVGFMYETPDQENPVYDAKGIETVRRDSCPATSKILEKSLRILFTSLDQERVKDYVTRQFRKISLANISLQDFIFAKEYRGRHSYRPGACVPALKLARKFMQQDPRSEPRVGERVPYVIVYGSPGLPLIRLVRTPQELLADNSLRINSNYYITRVIGPALNRALSLLGADTLQWYSEMPRVNNIRTMNLGRDSSPAKSIAHYFIKLNCPLCDELTNDGICAKCRQEPQSVVVRLNDKIRRSERSFDQISKICQSCSGCSDVEVKCVSQDCPNMFKLFNRRIDVEQANNLRDLLQANYDF